MSEIDALLQEDRSFPPSAAVPRAGRRRRSRRLRARRRAIPKRSGPASPASSNGSSRGQRCCEWKPPHAEVVRRRQAQRERQLPRPARPLGARRNKAALIWEGEPGDRRTLTYWDLYRQVGAFANVLKSLGRAEGRPRRALPAADPGAGHRDARLRPHRRGAQRRLRRLQRRVAARSHQRLTGELLVTADGGYRRGQIVPLKKMADEALERTPSIKNVVVVQRQAGSGDPGRTMKAGRDHWYHELDAGRVARLRARGDGRGGHALHPLHVRHHRQTQGDRPHDRRLPARHLRHDQVGLRPQGRRRLLVHRRHRLGDRPQLRRLRAAGQRRDGA